MRPGLGAEGSYAPGGWTVLFDYLRTGGLRKALQLPDMAVVVHVDTDVCEEIGFDVPRKKDGKDLDADELALAVTERLIDLMGRSFYETYHHRILFAIAVDEVECWLLPLLFSTSPAKRSKTTGCLRAADDELHRQTLPRLKKGDGKDPKAYLSLAKAYRKPKDLARHEALNPSLLRFVVEARRLLVPPEGP